ncbi:MAG TPA: hypothetical protein VF204_14580 [Streptosporangiaceae bacterium]
MNTRSCASLASWTAPITRSPSFSEITSKSLPFAGSPASPA